MENNDDLLKSLLDQLGSLSKQIAEANETLAPIKDAEIELNSQEFQLKEAFKKQMADLQAKRHEISEKRYQAQSEVNILTNQAKQIDSQVQAIKDQEAKAKAEEERKKREAEQYAALGKRFDNATLGAPWREWAKDHQISAGHKITQDRYVILADPMGLGKTLSSIITADMAEKVTKDAKPGEPFLGQEEQVFVPPNEVWTQKAINAYHMSEWPFGPDGPSTLTVTEIENTDLNKTELRIKNYIFAVGSKAPYLPYDLKMKLIELGFIEKTEGKYETKITNGIERPVGRKVLYFCPSPLLRNVLEEWRRWAPHRNVTYIGNLTKAERNFVLDLTLPKLNEYVIICNYEAWRRDKSLLEKLSACRFDTIIIDEAHNIKEMSSTAYKGVKEVIDNCKPEYVIPMTGTPILNRPQELYSLLTLINPQEFYSLNLFLDRYCEQYFVGGSSTPKYKFRPGGLDVLSKRISKNFLRRTKDQAGIVLPEKTIIYHELDRDDENYPNQAKARKHMKEFATIIIDANAGKALQANVIIALLTRLRQIETWPAGIIQRDKITKEVTLQLDVYESQKIDYILRFDSSTDEWEGLVPDTIEDERIVIFSQFKAPLHELRDRIEKMGYRAVVFDGDTPNNLRDEIRHDFDRSITPDRTKAKWDVLLANYRAAGVGLNLTAATQLITLDEEWNPGKRDQAWDRIHRIGQTQNVTINVVRTKDTVDTWLADIITQKESVVSGFESAMLSASDLKEALDSGLI